MASEAEDSPPLHEAIPLGGWPGIGHLALGKKVVKHPCRTIQRLFRYELVVDASAGCLTNPIVADLIRHQTNKVKHYNTASPPPHHRTSELRQGFLREAQLEYQLVFVSRY
jgi:hypothetical protein